MKVNQIVGEHKKGFRAKKYAQKPKAYIEPVKPQGPKSAEEQRKDVKEAGDVIKQYEPGKAVTVDNPNTGVSTTVDLTKSPGALRPNDKGELELDPTPDTGTKGAAPEAPKITAGAPVSVVDDQAMAEEPNEDQLLQVSPDNTNTYPVDTKSFPMKVMVNKGAGIPLNPASTEITNDLVKRSTDWSFCYIKANGKTYPALSTHKEVRVGPKDYAEIRQGQGDGYRPPRGSLGGVGPNGTMYKESADDVLLSKMLTIAGLK